MNKMHSKSCRDRFVLYPQPIQAPEVPYKNDRKPNPVIRARFMTTAAYLMEKISFIRYTAWKNAGFGSLSKIRDHIEHSEPWFDPTVLPREELKEVAKDQKQDLEVNSVFNNDMLATTAVGKNSASYYRELFLTGELTPLDVVHVILPLIRRDVFPPGKYSSIWFDVKSDLVIKAAKASTLRYKEKRSLGPLDGIPTAVKDEFDMDGYITTLGSINDYTGHDVMEGKIDSWLVRKIEDAGAILLGKLSMHEFGMDTSGNNITFGTPRNPYNPQYYPGGSSSGSACAVANGLIPFALGSDGGGSIRIPSSFCSVFGLKTTHGRLSFYPGQNHSNTCGVNGPIAADMQTLAAFYAILSQPHPTSYFPLTPSVINLQQDNPFRSKIIGIPEEWFQRSTPAIQTLCRNMINRLVKEKDYTIVPISIPFLVEGQIAHALTILTDAATLLPKTKGLSPANRILLALGRVTPSTDFLLAQKLRRVLMQHLAWLWQTHPGMMIVTPTTACAGWPIRSKAELKHGISDGDTTLKTMEYVWMANFCGVPSITVPAGYVVPEGQDGAGEIADEQTVGKVPVGMMAMGEWTGEEELMRFGFDAEELGKDLISRPPGWVDIVELAREKKRNGTP